MDGKKKVDLLDSSDDSSDSSDEDQCTVESVVSDGMSKDTIGESVDELEDIKISLSKLSLLFPSTHKILNRTRLTEIINRIQKRQYKHIVVLTGAGISTSSGIPDFRSAGTGIYANLADYKLPYPEAIFDIDFYRRNPMPFTRLARDLIPGKYQPTKSHKFIKQLQDYSLLGRNYTQNIDNLEQQAGISPDLLVQAHGSFQTAHCIECRRSAEVELVSRAIELNQVANCRYCKTGYLKPGITFFGEQLPHRFHKLSHVDLHKSDLVIIMGTSLSVYPFAGLVDRVPKHVSRLLINRELPGSSDSSSCSSESDDDYTDSAPSTSNNKRAIFDFTDRDCAILGDLDAICHELSSRI